MNQSFSEDESQYIQRFDTAVIHDFDFSKESGNQPMPDQQVEPTDNQEPITAAGPTANPQPEPLPEVAAPTEAPEQQSLDVKPEAQVDNQEAQITQLIKKLDPKAIPKFENQLVKPPVYCPVPSVGDDETALYVIDISQFKQQILPEGFPETTVWGYGGTVFETKSYQIKYNRSAPGATFETIRNVPLRVRWINNLTGSHLFSGEVSSVVNGHADAQFTNDSKKGPADSASLYSYLNNQKPATLWYHDYNLGGIQLSVHAGLAGFYLIRGGNELGYNKDFNLPKGQYEIPVIIQDASFNMDGSFSFMNTGVDSDEQLYPDAEYYGDAIMVNGKVWPNLDVERRQYRFRLLNGSSARTYHLKMSNGMAFKQIGNSSGFLPESAVFDSLLLAPAERADILVDFSAIAPGTKIILVNDANAPYPDGEAPEADTAGQILQFTVPMGGV
jgi:spore coat protein A, manganese oxidase